MVASIYLCKTTIYICINVLMRLLFLLFNVLLVSDAIKYKNDVLIRFTSKSCGICERFSKDWKRIVQKSDSNYIDSVDCDKNLKMCLDRDIRSFPTFILYSFWEGYMPYYGSTDEKALINFIKTLKQDEDCYSRNSCSPKFNKWLESNPTMSIDEARKNLTEVTSRFTAMFQNITQEVASFKRLALEKANYIKKYHTEL